MGRARNRLAAVATARDQFTAVLGTRRGTGAGQHELRPLPSSSADRINLWRHDGTLRKWDDNDKRLALCFEADGDLPEGAFVLYDFSPDADDFNIVINQTGDGLKNADSKANDPEELVAAFERAWDTRTAQAARTTLHDFDNPNGGGTAAAFVIEPDSAQMGYYLRNGPLRIPVSENQMGGIVHWLREYRDNHLPPGS